MKTSIICILLSFCSLITFAQSVNKTTKVKGTYYAYWGWNISFYNNSDIKFIGEDFDFVLKDVVAKDRPTDFSFKWYFHPGYITNPQYNTRIGYFIKDNLELSVGIDHMKYVVQQNQVVNISGTIDLDNDSHYNGTYDNDQIKLLKRFLKFEHTDGLNYVSVGLRKHWQICSFKFIHLGALVGGSIAALVPKTDVTLIEQKRHNVIHLSGFGINAMSGLNIGIGKSFFIQSELKGGYVNMSDVKITLDKNNYATQSFFFLQPNLVFGAYFSF